MTEAALQELIKREFPAEMPVTEVADKLDTMQAHPDIEQIRTWFNNVLLDFITLDYLEYFRKQREFFKRNISAVVFSEYRKIAKQYLFSSDCSFF